MEKFKLAFLTPHPIQYQAPLFRKLSTHPKIDLTVYFCSTLGADHQIDPGFGLSVVWDIPLLEGYKHKTLKNVSWSSSPEHAWSYINPAIVFEIKTGGYDAVIVHGYSEVTSWLAFASAIFRRIPFLIHGETVLSPRKDGALSAARKILLKALFRRCAALLYIGTKSRQFYEAFGVSKERLFFAPYSVDNNFFQSQGQALKSKKHQLRKELGINENLPVILYASKLIPRKRPNDLLEAFRSIQQKASLILVGDGELKRSLVSAVESMRIANVHFAGFVNQTELPKYYVAADLLVLPSEFESWGLVINEAMCFGLPIVTTTGVAAGTDLVREGENGFLFRAGDVGSLVGALRTLVDSPGLIAEQGKRSLEIISTWNYEKCVDGIVRALRHVTRKKG